MRFKGLAVALGAATVLVGGTLALAQPEQPSEGIDAVLTFENGLLVDVAEPAPPTTTTQPPVTTTTQPPVTTTTAAPPTTTTTQPPGNPDLGPDPAPPTGSAFTIMNGGTGSNGNQDLWDADYFRVLNSGCVWLDGERDGYRIAWMFLACGDHPSIGTYIDAVRDAEVALRAFGRNSPEYQAAAGAQAQAARAIPVSELVGKVTFVGGYGQITTAVQDEFMNEAERYWDATPYNGPPISELNDAPRPAGFGNQTKPDERPVLRFFEKATGDVLEVRSYLDPKNLGPNVDFAHVQSITEPFTDTSAPVSGDIDIEQREVVGSYLESIQGVNVYYESLSAAVGIDVQIP